MAANFLTVGTVAACQPVAKDQSLQPDSSCVIQDQHFATPVPAYHGSGIVSFTDFKQDSPSLMTKEQIEEAVARDWAPTSATLTVADCSSGDLIAVNSQDLDVPSRLLQSWLDQIRLKKDVPFEVFREIAEREELEVSDGRKLLHPAADCACRKFVGKSASFANKETSQ